MRSALTILGIVIGVAAVIAMVSVGRGAQNTITGSIQGIGTNLIFVFRGGSEDVRNPKPITLGDADAIGDPFLAPSVSAVAPVLQGSGAVAFAGETSNPQLSGVTPDYASVRNYKVAEGEFISEAAYARAAPRLRCWVRMWPKTYSGAPRAWSVRRCASKDSRSG